MPQWILNISNDAEGNLIKRINVSTDEIRFFEWDHRNRLVAVIDYDYGFEPAQLEQQVNFTYDVFNRLIRKEVDGTTYHTEVFVYDGNQIALRFADTDSSLFAYHLQDRYLWGPAVDQLLADEVLSAGQVSWALGDHQNTVRDVARYNSGTDATSVVNHNAYNSFGVKVSQSTPANDVLFGYTGRMFDEDIELQYNHNRWYDASARRWISEDPIGFAGDPSNVYRYVGNSPLNYVDPSGLWNLNPGGYGPPYGPYDPYPDPPKPPDHRGTAGFKICRRDIQGGDCVETIVAGFANCCGGAHTYLQYGGVDKNGNPNPGTEGWGIPGGAAGNLPHPEQVFNPDSCTPLTRSTHVLVYGPGAGKNGVDATDEEILDCIANALMTQNYARFSYNCEDWAKEAAEDCGLK
jgi:RHS repeat-associated protein